MVSWQCSGGVLVVLKEWYFLNQAGSPVNAKMGIKGNAKLLLLGLYAGLINPAGFSSAVIFVNVPFFSETQNGMEAV